MKLPDAPARIARLKINEKGFPVPWFVAWIDGKPDFRVVGEGKVPEAIRTNSCWICGEPLGRYKAFVVGPMCAVNRVSSEPPMHRECAEYAVKACPFMTQPKRPRRETNLPAEYSEAAGFGIDRNPGVSLIWITTSYKVEVVRAQEGIAPGLLVRMGEPEECLWFAEGRPATRAEIMHSIDTGLPILRGAAEKDGEDAVRFLEERTAEAMELVPAP